MKKHIQRQLLGLMKSVVNGVTYIKGNPQTNQTQTVYNDCNAAISMIRKTFESELSEQSYTSYTELFNKVMNGLEESAKVQEEVERKKLLNEAISALHDLDLTLQSETEINKEIVFFPYKASMWDSMESIWRAAKEDSRCDVYVVPIPHFANGIMTYEGHLYPKDVPVVHYSAYKMEVQKPDVTYIHQPYDGYNRTHKDDITYFASELKKHTKKLVYVPYYVTWGWVSEYEASLPSFKDVDLIVVQSEHLRAHYLKYWSKEKVVALGSPKFDKVIYDQQNGVQILQSWKEKIEGKKVVLYNTSISTLLLDVPNYLKKLEYVIESFESSEEMILLWRPHPLIKSKLQPVPEYLQAYTRLEQYFVQNNIGILDLTPDLHLAIAVADVYYGDYSSLIPLFTVTGKPMVLQDPSLLKQEEEKSGLRFEAIAVKDEQTMYGFSFDFNALFQVDLLTGNATLLGSVPNKLFSARGSYIAMEIVGDRIILVPLQEKIENRAPQFAEYSISSGAFTIKELCSHDTFENCATIKGMTGRLYSAAYKFEKSVFFIPYCYNAIVEYEVETGIFNYHQAPLEHMDKKNKQSCYFIPFGCQVGNELYLPLENSNKVLKFSMESGVFKWLSIGTKESRYSSCYSNGKLLWCVSFIDGSITQYNLKKFKVEKRIKLPKEIRKFLNRGEFFGSIISEDSELLFIPRFSNKAVRLEMGSSKMDVDKALPISSLRWGAQYTKAVLYENKNYLYNNHLRKVVRHDIRSKAIDAIKVTLSKEEVDRIVALSLHQQSSIQEGNEYAPEHFKDFIFSESIIGEKNIIRYLQMLLQHRSNVALQGQLFRDISENLDGTNGEKIHQFVMGKI